jgi:hypothetical protein
MPNGNCIGKRLFQPFTGCCDNGSFNGVVSANPAPYLDTDTARRMSAEMISPKILDVYPQKTWYI